MIGFRRLEILPLRYSSFVTNIFVNYIYSSKTGKEDLCKRVAQQYSEVVDRKFAPSSFPGSTTCRTEVAGILKNVFLGIKTIDKAFADAQAKAVFAIQ